MRFQYLGVFIVYALASLAKPLNSTTLGSAEASSIGISQSLYDDLTWYFKYATSAYANACPKPNGNTLVEQFSNIISDTQGFIARDDSRREIIVVLRGSESIVDALIDIAIIQVPLISPGISAPLGSLVHKGFLFAWNTVADNVLATVREQLAVHPGYSLVSTGHSLGGALSSLAGLALKQTFPSSQVRMYTYGQPRTFSSIAARFVNVQLGMNAFRSVHTDDSVPALLPQFIGYRHHGVEYWQTPDPASPATTKQCDPSGEDPTCSNQTIPTEIINEAHNMYYGISTSARFCT